MCRTIPPTPSTYAPVQPLKGVHVAVEYSLIAFLRTAIGSPSTKRSELGQQSHPNTCLALVKRSSSLTVFKVIEYFFDFSQKKTKKGVSNDVWHWSKRSLSLTVFKVIEYFFDFSQKKTKKGCVGRSLRPLQHTPLCSPCAAVNRC